MDKKQRITGSIIYWSIDAALQNAYALPARSHSGNCGNQHQGCFSAGLVFGKLKKERSGFSKGQSRYGYLPSGSDGTAKVTPNIEKRLLMIDAVEK